MVLFIKRFHEKYVKGYHRLQEDRKKRKDEKENIKKALKKDNKNG